MYASIMSQNAQTDTACDVAQVESLRLNVEQDSLAEGDVNGLPQVLLVQLADDHSFHVIIFPSVLLWEEDVLRTELWERGAYGFLRKPAFSPLNVMHLILHLI